VWVVGIMEFIEVVRAVDKNGEVSSIARRMFITNAFDSLLTSLGVAAGGYSNQTDPKILALGIIGAAIAMGLFSATLGVYLSEKAERERELKRIQVHVARQLDKDSIYYKAAKYIPIYVALWSGFGATLFPILVSLPFVLAGALNLAIGTAFISSLGIGLLIIGFLGIYLSKISGERLVSGLTRFTGIGIAAVVAILLIKSFFGLI
jgi:predicted membrane protein (TIGR00267 family)